MGVNFLDAGNALADPLRQAAHQADALHSELVHAALKLGDDVKLDRIERDRGERHVPVLPQQKAQDHHQGPALENRQGNCVADKAADGLDLGGDHLDHFALRGLAELRQRKSENPRIEIVTQPPKHALANAATVHIDDVFEALVYRDQNQEQAGEEKQILHLIEFESDYLDREIGVYPLDRLVDDLLRQLIKGVKERE